MNMKPTYEELDQKVRELESKVFEINRLVAEYERIFDYSLDLIGTGNMEGYFTKINASFSKILGYAEQEFLQKPFLHFVHDKDKYITEQALKDAAAGKKELYVENRYRCKNGSYIWLDWKVMALPEENKFIAVGRNITKRKQIEDELRDSEERFMMAGRAAYDLIYEWHVDSDSLLWFGSVDVL